MERGLEWHWTIRLHDRIGIISLHGSEDNDRGLAGETVDAVTTFWFGPLGNNVLRVWKTAENKSSRRLLERQGMRLLGAAWRGFVVGQLPAEYWEIMHEEWWWNET